MNKIKFKYSFDTPAIDLPYNLKDKSIVKRYYTKYAVLYVELLDGSIDEYHIDTAQIAFQEAKVIISE